MNIFVLDTDIQRCAESHLDRHVLKMIIEYAQLLSTAHRLIDGTVQVLEYDQPVYSTERLSDGSYKDHFVKNLRRTKNFWALPGETPTIQMTLEANIKYPEMMSRFRAHVEIQNQKCYNVTHQNHPCAVWVRESSENYMYLATLFKALCGEFTRRYKKTHKTESTIGDFLMSKPIKISLGSMTEFAQAMPEKYRDKDPICAYRNYYVGSKASIARWTNRTPPQWFKDNYKDYNAADFERTSSVS